MKMSGWGCGGPVGLPHLYLRARSTFYSANQRRSEKDHENLRFADANPEGFAFGKNGLCSMVTSHPHYELK